MTRAKFRESSLRTTTQTLTRQNLGQTTKSKLQTTKAMNRAMMIHLQPQMISLIRQTAEMIGPILETTSTTLPPTIISINKTNLHPFKLHARQTFGKEKRSLGKEYGCPLWRMCCPSAHPHNPQHVWDALVDTRIRLQKAVQTSRQLPDVSWSRVPGLQWRAVEHTRRDAPRFAVLMTHFSCRPCHSPAFRVGISRRGSPLPRPARVNALNYLLPRLSHQP